jgi:hypothetical protein
MGFAAHGGWVGTPRSELRQNFARARFLATTALEFDGFLLATPDLDLERR